LPCWNRAAPGVAHLVIVADAFYVLEGPFR